MKMLHGIREYVLVTLHDAPDDVVFAKHHELVGSESAMEGILKTVDNRKKKDEKDWLKWNFMTKMWKKKYWKKNTNPEKREKVRKMYGDIAGAAALQKSINVREIFGALVGLMKISDSQTLEGSNVLCDFIYFIISRTDAFLFESWDEEKE
jgi:hypothetical protein